jgi:hypothetical protein
LNRHLSANRAWDTDHFRFNNLLRDAVGLGDHLGFANLAAGRVRNTSRAGLLGHRAGRVRNLLCHRFAGPRAGRVRNLLGDRFAGPRAGRIRNLLRNRLTSPRAGRVGNLFRHALLFPTNAGIRNLLRVAFGNSSADRVRLLAVMDFLFHSCAGDRSHFGARNPFAAGDRAHRWFADRAAAAWLVAASAGARIKFAGTRVADAALN